MVGLLLADSQLERTSPVAKRLSSALSSLVTNLPTACWPRSLQHLGLGGTGTRLDAVRMNCQTTTQLGPDLQSRLGGCKHAIHLCLQAVAGRTAAELPEGCSLYSTLTSSHTQTSIKREAAEL